MSQMMACAHCHHAWRFHSPDTDHCRVTGCPCEHYEDPMEKMQQEMGGRQVVIDVPDGYILNMQLVPIGEVDGS